MSLFFNRAVRPFDRSLGAEGGSVCLPPGIEVPREPVALAERFFAGGEETANWVTHGIGLVLSVPGLALLIESSCRRGDAWHVASFTVFGLTLLLLYAASTLYHAHRAGRGKVMFLKLDHAAIFLLIAGTATPFLLTSLRGPWGWSLFGVIWTLCVAGIFLQRVFGARYPLSFTVAYLLIGWLVIVALKPLVASIPSGGLRLLLAGGGFYTVGVVFFLWRRLRYHHAVWHTFVLGGSICHFLAVLLFLLPPASA